MATKLGKDEVVVAADPAARARAAAIKAEEKAAIERAWAADHPRVPVKDIHAVQVEDYYTVTVDGAVFKCLVINAREVAIARVRPEDHQLLELAHRVAIPVAPTPPPPPSLVAQAVRFQTLCRDALNGYRREVNRWRDHVDPTRDHVADLRLQYPGTTRSAVPGRRDDYNVDGLRRLAQIIGEVAVFRRLVVAQGAAHRQLVVEANSSIRTARASLVVPALPTSILTAGEPPFAVMRSEGERALDAAEEEVGKLQEALETLALPVQQLSEVTPGYLAAALRTLREGWCAIAHVAIEIEIEALTKLRTFEPEREATNAVQKLAQHLGQEIDVPEIQWLKDLLTPPRLA